MGVGVPLQLAAWSRSKAAPHTPVKIAVLLKLLLSSTPDWAATLPWD